MRKSTVLVVDDDEDNAQVFEAALELSGFAVTTAGSMREACAALARESVDALVTDFSLGDGDGLELVRRLGTARPRVVVLVTGRDSPDDVDRSFEAGCDAHLVKPVSLEKLEQTLRDALAPSSDPARQPPRRM